MNIQITSVGFETTDPIRNYLTEKLKTLTHYCDSIVSFKAVLTLERNNKKDGHSAQCTMVANGVKLFAEEKHFDMYAAIDGLIDKLSRQITAYKEKLKKHKGKDFKHSRMFAE